MDLKNTEKYEQIMKNEETISSIIAKNERDVAVSEDRQRQFNAVVEKVKEEVKALGEVGENVDVDYLANNPEQLKKFIKELEDTVLSLQNAYLESSREYSSIITN